MTDRYFRGLYLKFFPDYFVGLRATTPRVNRNSSLEPEMGNYENANTHVLSVRSKLTRLRQYDASGLIAPVCHAFSPVPLIFLPTCTKCSLVAHFWIEMHLQGLVFFQSLVYFVITFTGSMLQMLQ